MTTQADLQALTDNAVARLSDLGQFASSLTQFQRTVLLAQLAGLTGVYSNGTTDHDAVAAGVLTSLQRLVEALQALYGDDPNEPITNDTKEA